MGIINRIAVLNGTRTQRMHVVLVFIDIGDRFKGTAKLRRYEANREGTRAAGFNNTRQIHLQS